MFWLPSLCWHKIELQDQGRRSSQDRAVISKYQAWRDLCVDTLIFWFLEPLPTFSSYPSYSTWQFFTSHLPTATLATLILSYSMAFLCHSFSLNNESKRPDPRLPLSSGSSGTCLRLNTMPVQCLKCLLFTIKSSELSKELHGSTYPRLLNSNKCWARKIWEH